MPNLSEIIVIAACLAVPVSIWVIVYFGVRILVMRKIKKDCGDMPSVEEIQAMYAENNKIIRDVWES